MDKIKYISAGAGSGKTYRLTHDLAKKIIDGDARPEQIILTTFTKVAANELLEQSREVLYEAEKYDEAAQLDKALIGTIDSVSEYFVRRYWYRLGINADVNVLDNETVDFFINRSLADLYNDKDYDDKLSFIREFVDAFNINDKKDCNCWKADLRTIIESSLRNQITDFDDSIKASYAKVAKFFKGTEVFTFDAEACKAKFNELCAICKNTRGCRTVPSDTIKKHFAGKIISLSDANLFYDFLLKFSEKDALMAQVDENEIRELIKTYSVFWDSEVVSDYLKKYISIIFEMAQIWLNKYAKYKKEHSVIDFMDMEKYFLVLLEQDEIKNEIQGRYKYVFVDEFQDCNPMQIKIFKLLAELVDGSEWVGDAKQAIYGFRGTDTQLTDNIANQYGNEEDVLHDCYRSLPQIVGLANNVFTHVFRDRFNLLPDERIVLNAVRRQPNENEVQLEDWIINKRSNSYETIYRRVAHNVAEMVIEQGINPKTIAILATTNNICYKIADYLQEEGISVNNSGNKSLSDCNEVLLVTSILSLLVDYSDLRSKALIAYLTQSGATAANIIDSKLVADDSKSWLADNPIISQLYAQRRELARLSIVELVKTIIVGFNLFDCVSHWDHKQKRKANLEQLINVAQQYEERCNILTMNPSISDFIFYLSNNDIKGAGDSDGVFVNTYHKAKGLQWDTVILLSLNVIIDDTKAIIKDNVFGVSPFKTKDDNYILSFLPSIFSGNSNIPSKLDDRISKSDDYELARTKVLSEGARLMYVGFTRARNHLILHSVETEGLQRMADICQPGKVTAPTHDQESCDIFNTEGNYPFTIHYYEDVNDDERFNNEEATCKVSDLKVSDANPESFTSRYVSPSKINEVAPSVKLLNNEGPQIDTKGANELNIIGDCLHNIFCLLRHTDSNDLNIAKAQSVIDQYQLPFRANEIVDSYNFLLKYLEGQYGNCMSVMHETPFFYSEDGAIVRGDIDFVYETQRGCVLVDFKTNRAGEIVTNPNVTSCYAGNYAGQFRAYTEALQRAGKVVIDKLVYYPVSGLIVRIE